MEIKNIPPEPPDWPKNIRPPVLIHELNPEPPDRPNINQEWANRPIFWNQHAHAATQAHRQGHNRQFKLALVVIGVILIAFILNKVSQPKMNLTRYGSAVSSASGAAKDTKSDPADRLVRAIDRFLGK